MEKKLSEKVAKSTAKELDLAIMLNEELPVRRLKSKWDFVGYKPVWTTNQKSRTIPNRTLSLRQIADRYANGLTTLDEKVGLYDEGRTVIKDFNKLDLTERMEIVRNAEAEMRKIIHARQVKQKEVHEKRFSEILQASVDAEIKKRETAFKDAKSENK